MSSALHRCLLTLALAACVHTPPPPPSTAASVAFEPEEPLFADPLVTEALVPGQAAKRSSEGAFGPKGWTALSPRGALVIEVADPTALEGALEVDVTGLAWAAANASAGADMKLHFINMFSNPNGDHHADDGGGPDDALWTLRAGAAPDGQPRYGDSFKVLWASRGAKRSPGSDYHEVVRPAPAGWRWDPRTRYTFRVTWSQRRGTWDVAVNGRLFYEQPWRHQRRPLRYVWLGRGADFGSMQGVWFSHLRVYGRAGAKRAVVAPPEGARHELTLEALRDFPVRQVPPFAPFYANPERGALAIDTRQHADRLAAARTTFTGPPGHYDLTLVSLTERDGESLYRVRVNGHAVFETRNPPAPDDLEALTTAPAVALAPGDVLQIEAIGVSNRKEPEGAGWAYARGRWRRLLLTPRP